MFSEELFHPAVSHFPISLLTLVFFTKLAQFIVTKKYKELAVSLNIISKFLLTLGAIFLIPTIFLGDMAFDIVKNDICNIVMGYQHEELSHYTLIIFIFALTLDILPSIRPIPIKFHTLYQIALILCLGWGNFYLFKTAQLGGKLVYEQGAGVKHKTSCKN
jgi:uncharacterized membrane protein